VLLSQPGGWGYAAALRPLPMTLTHPFADDSLPAQPEVLLVDDDEVNLLLIALALRERGFKIVEASSGEQALAMLPTGRPTSSCWTP
jgi:PleD family two-component response regulator